jgi:hypothetical protein
MKFANATNTNRKFGEAEWRDLRFLFPVLTHPLEPGFLWGPQRPDGSRALIQFIQLTRGVLHVRIESFDFNALIRLNLDGWPATFRMTHALSHGET